MKTIRIILAVLAFSLLAASSYAQTPHADVSVGYSYLHFNASNGADGANNNGFSGSVAYNVTGLFGIVGDLGLYRGSVSGLKITSESYTFGPRFSVRGHDRFVPFVQALFGGAHHNSNYTPTYDGYLVIPSANAFAFSFGGGTDISITRDNTIALRPQFDYIGLHNDGSTTNSERISISFVFNLGKK